MLIKDRRIQIGMSLVLLFAGARSQAEAVSLATLATRLDRQCVQFQTIGVCHRNTPPYVGVKVRYRQPVLLVETVKRPGESAIDEYQSLVRRTTSDHSDACSSSMSDGTSTQMNEAHVFGFPLGDVISTMIEAPCEGPPDLTGVVSYMSELDADEWRTARQESRHPLSLLTAKLGSVCDGKGPAVPGLCMGTWGPLYPRQGFLAHYSQAVGSAVAAYRAVDIASLNILSPHHKMGMVMFLPDMIWDRMQMLYPTPTSCLMIGESPELWENGRISEDGKVVWAYWRKKECCLF